jgi:hypothetical protein
MEHLVSLDLSESISGTTGSCTLIANVILLDSYLNKCLA